MSPPRHFYRILFVLLAILLCSTQLPAQTMVSTTNQIGQPYSYLSGIYTSSYWLDCTFGPGATQGTVEPPNSGCYTATPLEVQYGHGVAGGAAVGIEVFDPSNFAPPVTYPLTLNAPLTLDTDVGQGAACPPPNNPPLDLCPNFDPLQDPPGVGAMPFAIHIDAQGAQITGAMDQCSIYDCVNWDVASSSDSLA